MYLGYPKLYIKCFSVQEVIVVSFKNTDNIYISKHGYEKKKVYNKY